MDPSLLSQLAPPPETLRLGGALILTGVRRTVIVGLALTAVAALGVMAYSLGVLMRGGPELHGTALEDPPSVADVTLVAAGGERVRLGDFQGKRLLVFFGYSNCPDVCPLTMARLSSMYRSLDEPDEVQVVMITVDPERDTPEVIGRYARGFHREFIGLGGAGEEVEAAAASFYVGHRDSGDGEVVHGSQVLLVDPSGRFERVYNDQAQLHLEADLQALLGGDPG